MREMKDSGVQWIGEIPSIWVTKKLKYLCSYKTGGTPPEKRGISLEDSIPWITPKDLSDNLYITKSEQFISPEMVLQCGYCLFPQGSTLLVCIASIGKIGLAIKDCFSNQQITALIPKNSIHPLFLSLAMRSAEQQLIFDASCNVVPILNNKYLSQFPIPVPPYAAQARIASFLDAKCAEIDALSADIQKEIETLQEYRKSVITEAVTKGLDPNVEMKDSGVEWIEETNSNPLRIKLKYLLENTKNAVRVGPFGSQLSGTDLIEDNTGYYIINQRSVLDHKDSSDVFVSKDKYEELSGFQIKIDDIFITTRGTIGKIHQLRTSNILGVIHPCIIRFRINPCKCNYKYLEYIFNDTDIVSEQVMNNSNTTTIPVLYSDSLRNLVIPFWSMPIQLDIVKYLGSKCAEIDSLISDKQKQLETLAEYRKSLIYEYVTGKKEVPTT